jgi:N-acyl homoserine lactone hydrolase
MRNYAKVYVLHTGELTYDQSLAFKELDVIPAVHHRGKEYQQKVPVSSYLIEHPKGNIVVDTGWHEEIRTNPKKHLGEDLYQFIEYKLPEGHSIKEQLAAKNLSPEDIGSGAKNQRFMHNREIRLKKGVCMRYEISESI